MMRLAWIRLDKCRYFSKLMPKKQFYGILPFVCRTEVFMLLFFELSTLHFTKSTSLQQNTFLPCVSHSNIISQLTLQTLQDKYQIFFKNLIYPKMGQISIDRKSIWNRHIILKFTICYEAVKFEANSAPCGKDLCLI